MSLDSRLVQLEEALTLELFDLIDVGVDALLLDDKDTDGEDDRFNWRSRDDVKTLLFISNSSSLNIFDRLDI